MEKECTNGKMDKNMKGNTKMGCGMDMEHTISKVEQDMWVIGFKACKKVRELYIKDMMK